MNYIFTARVRSTREGNIYTWKCLSVHFWGGGSQVSDFWGGPRSQIFGGGGVPGLRFFLGGSQVSDFSGGVPGLRFLGGVQGLRFFLGGFPGLRFFWGGSQVSDFQGGPSSQIFWGREVCSLTKGKNF